MAQLAEFLRTHVPKGFSSKPYYSAHGDALIFYFKDEPSYAHRVDKLLTVYHSLEGNEIVGCEIKGIRVILRELGSFGIEIHSGKMELALLFLGYVQIANPPREEVEPLKRAFQEAQPRIDASDLVPC